jgi:hypothetical protein
MQQGKNKIEVVDEGYRLPEEYFTEFKQELMSKINKPKETDLKVSYTNILIKALLMAASFLLLITLMPSNEVEVQAEDFISYIENTEIDAWDEEVIIEALNIENLTDEGSEELINYLEDTDLETILESI